MLSFSSPPGAVRSAARTDRGLTPSVVALSSGSRLRLPVRRSMDLGLGGAARGWFPPRLQTRPPSPAPDGGGMQAADPHTHTGAGGTGRHCRPGRRVSGSCCFLVVHSYQGLGEGTARARRPDVRLWLPVPPPREQPSVCPPPAGRSRLAHRLAQATQKPRPPAGASLCLLHRGPSPSLGEGTPSPVPLPAGMLPQPWGVFEKPLSM